MRFEFWIDYLCPITYLTHKNLTEALDELNIKHYDLFYRSYQIDENHVNNLKLTTEQKNLLKDHDLKLKNFDTNYLHQIAHLAKRKGLAREFNEIVLNEIFEKNKTLDKKEDVLKLALKAGLENDDSSNVLNTECYTKQISCNKLNALNRKINLIPHLRINIKHHFNGYMTKEEIIKKIKNIMESMPKTEYCSESCICGSY